MRMLALLAVVALVSTAGLLRHAGAGGPLTGPVVTYAGAINQDGCEFCCKFACRLTPTPTPAFDDQGRRVFEHTSGRPLFVVEAKAGLSFLPPGVGGTRRGDEIVGFSGSPDLKVLYSRNLGNGSQFIECNTTINGGIPAAPGLDPQETLDALEDAACRFEWFTENDPCTRDRFGGLSPIASDTKTQYCFAVPLASQFHPGDTVVSIQLMDVVGNLGPTEEVVVRVGTAGATPTPTPTVVGQFGISGSVAHFGAGLPVAGVTLSASAGSEAVTSDGGGYLLGGLPMVNVEITADKDGGTGAAVSALDAAYILQATSGQRTLLQVQELACDVTGDGTLSNLDASMILKRIVGLIDSFPIAEPTLCDSDWGFIPFAAPAPNQTTQPPMVGGGVCQPGAIQYFPLAASATNQSFIAYAYGDCTGNWAPPPGGGGAAAAALGAAEQRRVRLGRTRRARSRWVKVPIHIDGPRFNAAEVEIAYDEGALRPVRLRRTRRLKGGIFHATVVRPGIIRIAAASASAMRGDGRALAMLRFEALSTSKRRSTRIRVQRATVDEAG